MQQVSNKKLNTSNNMINNIPSKDRQSTKYRRKYKYLKKVIKSLIIVSFSEIVNLNSTIMYVTNRMK